MRTPAIMAAGFRHIVRAVGHVMSRPRCCACDELLATPSIFCEACCTSVVWDTRGAANATPLASVLYGGSPAVALRRLKYESRPDLAVPLGELLRAALQQVDPAADLILPIPLHPRRLVQRQYNQSALLAAAVAKEVGAPLDCTVLRRARDTVPQVGLPRAQRRANLDGAFSARSKGLEAKTVWLVDDVSTTGATLDSARRALLAAGARSVRTLVVARAES